MLKKLNRSEIEKQNLNGQKVQTFAEFKSTREQILTNEMKWSHKNS